MTDVKRFVVDRSRWLRGEGGAQLLVGDGRMCCLGFVCEQSGLDKEKLLRVSEPEHINEDFRGPVIGLLVEDLEDFHANTPLTESAMRINDDDAIVDDAREAELSALFAEHGYEMVFVDAELET